MRSTVIQESYYLARYLQERCVLVYAKNPYHTRGDTRSRLGHRHQRALAHHLEQLRAAGHQTVESARVTVAQPPHLDRVGFGLGHHGQRLTQPDKAGWIFLGQRLDHHREWTCVGQRKRAVAQPAQFGQMGHRAKLHSDVARERTHVGAGGTGGHEMNRHRVDRVEHQARNLDLTRGRRLNLGAAPRKPVKRHAVALDRGEDRRLLHDPAGEARGGFREHRGRERWDYGRLGLGAGAIERVGPDTEPDHTFVLFYSVLQKWRELGGLANQNRQQAGGEWIECAQMADAGGTNARLDLAHDLGRGNPRGLVDD